MRSRRLQLILVWLVVLGLWEGSYRVVQWRSWIFPAPSHVVDATLGMLSWHTRFGDKVESGWPWPKDEEISPAAKKAVLPEAVFVSGKRLAIGFAASLALGMLLGIAVWRSSFLDALLGPLFLGLQTLPSVCWVPLAVLTLGINEKAILMVLVLGSCFATAIAQRDGMRMIPPIFHRAGLMLGARRWRLYRYVLLPASLPAMASSLRQGFSFAWRSLMGAELILIPKDHGLGYLLSVGRDFNDVAQVMAVMIMMVAIGMAVDRWVFAVLEQRVRLRFGLIDRH